MDIEPGNEMISLVAKVPFVGAIDLNAPATMQAEPSQGIDIKVNAINRANGPDAIKLKTILPFSSWKMDPLPSATSPELSIGEGFDWMVHIEVPTNTPATLEGGSGYQVLFIATSNNEKDLMVMNITSVQVGQFNGMAISVQQDTMIYDGKDPVAFDAIVENLGNGVQEVFLKADTPYDWSVQISEPKFTLMAFERAHFTLYVAPGSDARAGTYDVVLKATGENITEHDILVHVLVEKANGLLLKIGDQGTGEPPGPGEGTMVPFKVTNMGNHLELVGVVPVSIPDGWSVTVEPSIASLPAGASSIFHATIVTASDPMRSLKGTHTIMVEATSMYNGEVHRLPIGVNVKGVASMVLIADDPIKIVNPSIDPSPIYIMMLRNSGNVRVSANITMDLPPNTEDWVMPSSETVTVDPGEVGAFHAIVTPTLNASDGNYQFGFHATTGDGGGYQTSVDLMMSVVEADVTLMNIEVRKAGLVRWGDQVQAIAGTDIEVVAWIFDGGSQRAKKVDLELLMDGRIVDIKENYILSSNITGVKFETSLKEGWHDVSVHISASGESRTDDNELSLRAYGALPPDGARSGAIGLGLSLTTILFLIGIILTNEGWKFKFLCLVVVPLYSRIRKETTLDNFTRGRIFGYIEANPGEHYNAIRKALSLSNGSLAYHINTLVREGFIKFEIDGNHKRFYPKRMHLKGDKKGPVSIGYLSKIQKIIINKISEVPGISQRQIARNLNMSPSTINYHVRNLALAGVLRLERGVGRTRCFKGDDTSTDDRGIGQ